MSTGLHSDWSFEEDFLRHNPQARLVCFDHTVTKDFWTTYTLRGLRYLDRALLAKPRAYRQFFAQSRAEHRPVAIGYDRPGSVSLTTILAEYPDNRVLLKIDIEGWEYRILDQIIEHQDPSARQ